MLVPLNENISRVLQVISQPATHIIRAMIDRYVMDSLEKSSTSPFPPKNTAIPVLPALLLDTSIWEK